MRHTIIIALLLITLFPNTALAQWGFDAVSVEAYINDHKKQRSLLLARSTLEYSNQLLHEYSSEEVGKYKELNVDLDKYTRAFDIIDVMYQSLRTNRCTSSFVKSTSRGQMIFIPSSVFRTEKQVKLPFSSHSLKQGA